MPDEIASVEHADVVLEAYFKLGDPNLFARHIDAMADWRFRSSIAAILDAGDFVGNYDEFVALLRHCGVISLAQLAAYNVRYDEQRHDVQPTWSEQFAKVSGSIC